MFKRVNIWAVSLRRYECVLHYTVLRTANRRPGVCIAAAERTSSGPQHQRLVAHGWLPAPWLASVAEPVYSDCLSAKKGWMSLYAVVKTLIMNAEGLRSLVTSFDAQKLLHARLATSSGAACNLKSAVRSRLQAACCQLLIATRKSDRFGLAQGRL